MAHVNAHASLIWSVGVHIECVGCPPPLGGVSTTRPRVGAGHTGAFFSFLSFFPSFLLFPSFPFSSPPPLFTSDPHPSHLPLLLYQKALTTFIAKNQVNRILVTPSLLQLLLDTFDKRKDTLKERLSCLKLMWLCGEVVTIEIVRRFCEILPDARLINLYSISECHDVSIIDLASMDTANAPSQYASAGRIIPNVEVYCVDTEAKPWTRVPLGEPGEIFVGGPTLARGYLNMPEATAEVMAGSWLRTGDVGALDDRGYL